MKNKKILIWVLFFLIFFTVAQLFQKKPVTPEAVVNTVKGDAVTITLSQADYSVDQDVSVKVRNNTNSELVVPSNCPNPPLSVKVWNGEKFVDRTVDTKVNCSLVPTDVKIAPGAEAKVGFTYWNHSLFGEVGRYKLELSLNNGTTTGVFASQDFTVSPTGFWKKLFRAVFYQPIYNALILFLSFAPAKDLGFAIILLTLVIRLILLIPSQHAMLSQRKMQELQPRLQAIQKKYEGNKERIAQETMTLWKENKVNPFGSCLPLLVQFPVLIALFYVIQNGLNPDNVYMLYGPLKGIVDLSTIHTNFLGVLELTKMNTFVLPLIIGALQFGQLKLAMLKKKKPEGQETKQSEMETANKMMIYVMPVMIAMFTASVPAGVGLYWGISTLFALGQQLVVNKKAI
jgi:YidC/Oxa1 family membrane protein insertase